MHQVTSAVIAPKKNLRTTKLQTTYILLQPKMANKKIYYIQSKNNGRSRRQEERVEVEFGQRGFWVGKYPISNIQIYKLCGHRICGPDRFSVLL